MIPSSRSAFPAGSLSGTNFLPTDKLEPIKVAFYLFLFPAPCLKTAARLPSALLLLARVRPIFILILRPSHHRHRAAVLLDASAKYPSVRVRPSDLASVLVEGGTDGRGDEGASVGPASERGTLLSSLAPSLPLLRRRRRRCDKRPFCKMAAQGGKRETAQVGHKGDRATN